jgi:hypothetical protein
MCILRATVHIPHATFHLHASTSSSTSPTPEAHTTSIRIYAGTLSFRLAVHRTVSSVGWGPDQLCCIGAWPRCLQQLRHSCKRELKHGAQCRVSVWMKLSHHHLLGSDGAGQAEFGWGWLASMWVAS